MTQPEMFLVKGKTLISSEQLMRFLRINRSALTMKLKRMGLRGVYLNLDGRKTQKYYNFDKFLQILD
ncbi:MAG: hypothetical protein LBQ47_07640 [Endomicrobium sp.]|jgi:hypothetical protein|nr:hypothetical protein [Endomicrobium sp.]